MDTVQAETKEEDSEGDEDNNKLVKNEADETERDGDAGGFKRCSFCAFTASTVRDIRKHKKERHREMLKVIQCDQCSFVTHWKDSMTLHRKYHDLPAEWSQVKCDHCDYIYAFNPKIPKTNRRAQQQLNGHMNEEHAELKLPCQHCDKTFWTEKRLTSHTLSHTHVAKREYHKTGAGTDGKGSLQCEHCDYKCKNASRLKFHINAVHLGVRPHLCDFCPSSFPTKGALNTHRKSHTNERNFPCMFCEKKFHSKGNLLTHVRTHTGEKPFTCDECGKSFSDQAYFSSHKRTHILGADGQRIKEFSCHICSKTFTRNAYLRQHMTAHDDSSELIGGGGTWCGGGKQKKYTNEFKVAAIEKVKEIGLTRTAAEMKCNLSTLKNWIQLTLMPHKCHICDKAFPYKAQLTKHVATHPEYKEENGLVYQESLRQSNLRYDKAYKQEVALYAIQHSIQVAAVKFNLAQSTINYWVQLMNNPKPCYICGKEFSNESTVKRHIEQVHKTSPEGSLVPSSIQNMADNQQCFSSYLADNNMLPGSEFVSALQEMKEKKEREKLEMAPLAREIFEKEKERWELEKLRKEEERLRRKEENELKIKEGFTITEAIHQEEAVKLSLKLSFNKSTGWNCKQENIGSRADNGELDAENCESVNDEKQIDQNDNDEEHGFDDQIERNQIDNNDELDFKDVEVTVKSEMPSEAEDDEFRPDFFEPTMCLQTNDGSNSEEDIKAKIEDISPRFEEETGKIVKEELNNNSNCESEEEKPVVKKKRGKGKVRRKKIPDPDRKSGPYCKYCNKLFSTEARAIHHEKVIHEGESTVNCEFCGTQFKEGHQLKEHQERMHWKELEERTGIPAKKFSCPSCSRFWRIKRDLDRHIKVFHGPKIPQSQQAKHMCEHCGKSFTRLQYRKKHEAKFHGVGILKVKDFPCPHCDVVYHVKDHLNRHVKAVHENVRFQCEECSKLFSDRSGLVRHKLYHGDPQFQCDECPEKFREGRHLKRHKRVHAGEIDADKVCEFCQKDFSNLQSLRNHQLHICEKAFRRLARIKYHKFKPTSQTNNDKATTDQPEQPVVCSECGREYASLKLLKSHMRVHSKAYMEAKYTCDICGNEYRSNVSLQNHINTIHNGLRNFPCDICGKLFTRANTLRTHKKIHDGLKQFNCIYCNSAYGEKRNLMNHIRRNHPGYELKFRRVTPNGEVILDEKTTLHDVSVKPVGDNRDQSFFNTENC